MFVGEIGTFLVLLCLEIVLGFDNLLLISIIAQRVPVHQQHIIRRIGITMAAVMRIGLLFIIGWIASLNTPVFSIGDLGFSWRDIILSLGGVFLIWKAVTEIHHTVEHKAHERDKEQGVRIYDSGAKAVLQIMIIDSIFSIDSILTGVGLTENIMIIVAAILISLAIMLIFVNKIADFIAANASLKILALSFMLVIGVTLFLESFDQDIPKQYLYAPLVFALFIQALQLRYEMNRVRKAKVPKPKSLKRQAKRNLMPLYTTGPQEVVEEELPSEHEDEHNHDAAPHKEKE
jgi:predicted tellurium resistance membrane protein TerC